MSLLLSGDVEANPGPRNTSTYPCGFCDIPVNWSCEGVCCDECSIWYHRSCLELCSADFDLLEYSHVQWLCCKCESINVNSFTFRSYETDSNYYAPIKGSDITLDSINSSVFSPIRTSSPRTDTSRTNSASKSTNRLSSSTYPKKRNLRILNMNCRSIIEKRGEFSALLEYTQPDIVCGTESWLKGIKPGSNPTSDSIKSCEVFSSHYKSYRNDRSSLGGGVFILVHEDLISVEQPEFVTICEITWVKVHLKGCKELYIGCFYMPHRNRDLIKELDRSLELLTVKKDRQIILCGDFNCPDVDWTSLSVTSPVDRIVHQDLIDLSIKFDLTQVQESPTRQGNILDLVFTTNPSLIKSTTVIPGISDHDIVVVDSDTKPHYNRQKPRKSFLFGKANWDALRVKCKVIYDTITQLYQQNKTIEDIWSYFKSTLLKEIETHIPSRTSRRRKSPPWLNHSLRKMSRRKTRLHTQAKKTRKWENYRHFQRECKRAYRRAEWSYVNNTIQEGLLNNNSKPFWSYVKSKQQDNIGVSPLKRKGQLLSDSKSKAVILINQFSSVFTQDDSNIMPPVSKTCDSVIPDIIINEEDVLKLLKNIQTAKAPGPDSIPNRVLKECATELAPSIALLFQKSLDTGCLPRDWLNANIAPVFKKGDRHLPENYRPVSLTSVLSKLLEHVVCRHIMKHFERHNILTSLNHGFRTSR
ncbi:hypothetical protein FSP39_016928 [Pinctada imbricata]|uniref:PHD-type domain-containing protein n=1 Tax=Pinctada imbricata TaxID=66713 RepID=A0AA89CDF3_PINIB|nr:hypothetical protein FSP39_016928 [Pinctada imbricata]